MTTTTTAKKNPPKAHQDLMGAEYLASRELAAVGGFWIEFAQQLGEIQQQQVDWWLTDMAQSASRLGETSAPTEVFLDHMSRRVNHTMEGATQVSNLWSKEFDRTLTLHRRLWAPYLSQDRG